MTFLLIKMEEEKLLKYLKKITLNIIIFNYLILVIIFYMKHQYYELIIDFYKFNKKYLFIKNINIKL